jgi:recombination protein RecT
MSETQIIKKEKTALQTMLSQENVVNQFREVLKDKAPAFIASIAEVGMTMPDVAKYNPSSIIRAALVAATLNLPINKSLGFAWVVPYGQGPKAEAQFQMGWKGYVQLGQRTGQYKTMNVLYIHKNQFKSWSALTETFEGDVDAEPEGPVIGFLFYFETITGFRKTIYKSRESLIAHGRKFSKAFNSQSGAWKNFPDEMCAKTLIKMALSKWGPLSVEMGKANQADQAIIVSDNLAEDTAFTYPDNEHEVKNVISTDLAPSDTNGTSEPEPGSLPL